MAKVTAKYQVTIPPEVRKELGILPGTQVDIAKKGKDYILMVEPLETLRLKWCGIFKSSQNTMEYLDDIRGKVS